MAINTDAIAGRANQQILAIGQRLEAVSAGMRALGSDMDGLRVVEPAQATHLLSLFAETLARAQHELGRIFELTEALADQADSDDAGLTPY